jgi:hypothetical protein
MDIPALDGRSGQGGGRHHRSDFGARRCPLPEGDLLIISHYWERCRRRGVLIYTFDTMGILCIRWLKTRLNERQQFLLEPAQVYVWRFLPSIGGSLPRWSSGRTTVASTGTRLSTSWQPLQWPSNVECGEMAVLGMEAVSRPQLLC